MTEIKIVDFIGNQEILTLQKTAFLCSRKVPASIVLKCYDWAIAQREAGNCVISGFHSTLEKDVLTYLVKGNQPVIIALARGIKKRIEPELKKSLDTGRLLMVTPFPKDRIRITTETATIRNQLMALLAEEIVVGFAKEEGNVAKLVREYQGKKPVSFL